VKLSKLPSKRFKTPASLTWCARSSPDELLQRQNLVSVTRFACGRPHLLGREADETSHSMPPPLAPAGFDSGRPVARRQHLLRPRPPIEDEGRDRCAAAAKEPYRKPIAKTGLSAPEVPNGREIPPWIERLARMRGRPMPPLNRTATSPAGSTSASSRRLSTG
jgi:hypothetical protein